ncbi:unnamed protein product [Coregonus sp. 'balchen']|nr:unnamed protein product [Coregonus sp. 'balchen']
MENRQQYPLEPIQEEEEEDEEEEVVVDDKGKDKEEKEEEESPLKVWRQSRQSRSLDQSSAAQVEIYSLSVPYPTTTQTTSNLGDEITTPGRGKQTSRTRRRLSWSSSDEELPTPQGPQKKRGEDGQKKIGARRRRKVPTAVSINNKPVVMMDDPFPQWLVNLMHNIEEATTHELVVE